MDAPSRAELSCGACKKLKRKCDKSLPECGLCQRTGRRCDYTNSSPAPTAADLAAVQAKVTELEQRLAAGLTAPRRSEDPSPGGSNLLSDFSGCETPLPGQFPAALFLDFDCFKWTRMRLPQPSVEIPTNVLALLTQGNIIVETSKEFFDTIHLWMPVISKKRVNLGFAVHHGGPDIAMLFLAMRLIMSPPASEYTNVLYSLSKSFLTTLESSGVVSCLCLQALLLVALFEFSHAIYPAAWMTVGTCARYVELLGISCSISRNTEVRPSISWTEIEERRRLWWGVFILDRLISIGNRKNFCLSGPPDDGLLPVDDQAWDEGDVAHIQARPISTNAELDTPPFAQLCQAALLVDLAIKTTWRAPLDSTDIARTPALIDQMCTFISVVDAGGNENDATDLSRISPRAASRSALFTLLDLFSCPEKMSGHPGFVIGPGAKSNTELELQMRAMSLTIDLANQIHSIIMQLMDSSEADGSWGGNLSQISPYFLDVTYCTLATYHWFAAEQGDEAYRTRIKDLCVFLERIGPRWRLGHEYLKLTRYYDSNTRSSLMSEV